MIGRCSYRAAPYSLGRLLRQNARKFAATFGLLAVTGCVTPGQNDAFYDNTISIDALRPEVIRSAKSYKIEAHYQKLQDYLLVRGLLRKDGGGVDTPFSTEDLVQNFVRIAFFDEYDTNGGLQAVNNKASPLRRWDGPIRMSIEFGDTVSAQIRKDDLPRIKAYAKRLERVSRKRINLTNRHANYHVLVLNEDDRRQFGPRLRDMIPGASDGLIRTVENLPKTTLCLVLALSEAQSTGGYTKAVAIIGAEHPDLLRWSCVHEEVAQGLGLANDSAAARPSIFNDDEEFALLTSHDEMLLRMLYDPRLKTGMSAQEALPIVRRIAAELTGGT